MAKFNTKKGNKKGQKGRNVNVANKIKKKAIKTKGKVKGDARNLIRDRKIGKIRHGGDARDILANLAKGTDARQKLVKNRLLKRGIMDAKTTKKGGITIVTTTKGKLQLTTKRKSKTGKTDPLVQVSKIGKNVTKSVNHASGQISLNTKPKPTALNNSSNSSKNKPQQRQQRRASTGTSNLSSSRQGIERSSNKSRSSYRAMTPAARLDEELMNTHVDPIVIKRTVRQNVRDRSPIRPRSPLETYQYRERSRSRSPPRYTPRYHYDDPRRELREEEMYRQRIREESRSSLLTSEMRYSSPLQGVKVVVSNLEESVTQEDLTELFGDVGNVKRVKMCGKGVSEIVFSKRADADKAIEIYDKRQLDGRAMKLTIEGGNIQPKPYVSSFKMPSRREDSDSRGAAPDISSIHKALFNERRSATGSLPFASSGGGSHRSLSAMASSNQKFTVVMPPGGGRRRH